MDEARAQRLAAVVAAFRNEAGAEWDEKAAQAKAKADEAEVLKQLQAVASHVQTALNAKIQNAPKIVASGSSENSRTFTSGLGGNGGSRDTLSVSWFGGTCTVSRFPQPSPDQVPAPGANPIIPQPIVIGSTTYDQVNEAWMTDQFLTWLEAIEGKPL